jgi:predicted DsbA family dithiol-disulfide isomerase
MVPNRIQLHQSGAQVVGQTNRSRVLIQQYFAEGLNVDDAESLANIGSSVGLNRDAVIAAFASPEIAAEMLVKSPA